MTKPIDPDALTDHLEGMRRLARTLVRDQHEADDVVQDTMVAALESRSGVRSGLRSWLSGVARNMARRTARSAGRRARHEGEAAQGGATAPATADVILRAAEQGRVLDALVHMEEPYRSAVLLRYVEDLPPRVIARRMDLPVETVRTHIKRGVQRLRDRLDEAHGGHAGDSNTALRLAGTETLGARHARAVALARASGVLVLLIAVGVLFWSLDGKRADDAGPTYLSESTSLAENGAQESEGPVAPVEQEPGAVAVGPGALSSERGTEPGTSDPLPGRVAPPGGARPNGLPATPIPEEEPKPVSDAAPEPNRTQPQRAPDGATGLPRVAEEDEPLPEGPREAVEEGAVEKTEPENGGKGKPAPAEPATGEDTGEGEFYDGETSFSAKQVKRAIDKGVSWLKRRQGRDGSWGPIRFNASYDGRQQATDGMPAGPTALALYALLKCKASPDDPTIKRGFDFLRKRHREPASSYETSMLLLAVTATADQDKLLKTQKSRSKKPKLKGRFRKWAAELADHLVSKREGQGWRYNIESGRAAAGDDQDLSSTQLAALALFAAHRLGIRVKRPVWEDILAFTLAQQSEDGPRITYRDPVDASQKREARARGFAYMRGAEDPDEGQPRGGMTACGLANLEMARYVLSEGGEKRAQWDKRDDAVTVQEAIFDGLAWLDQNWSPFEDPQAKNKNVYHVYWLYALERAMDLLDLKLLGSHRWYSEMGQELLNRQAADGHWSARGLKGGHDVLDTSFALLFLKRATKDAIPFGSVTGGRAAPPDNR